MLDPDILPLPRALEYRTPPDMILPPHDFGPEVGVRKAITLRDFLLLEGITRAGMKEMDQIRAAKGLSPLWKDD